MPTDIFKASVQYNDWRGTSAADSADIDNGSAKEWLEKNGYKRPEEFLLGIEMHAGENYGTHKDPVYVEFLLIELDSYEDVKQKVEAGAGAIDVKRVVVDMSLEEFFGLFKRFEVALSAGGLFDGHEYTYSE